MIQVRGASVEEIYHCAEKIPEFERLYPVKEFEKRLTGRHLNLVATQNSQIIGFKCGYQADRSDHFYSWMGGVLPGHRNKGVAQLLLEEMEQWCINQDFRHLTFKTFNQHKGMLIFALKNGFEITDVTDSEKDKRKRIVLSKSLI